MSIYDRPVSQLTTTDLQELLDAGAVENVRLEFKREVPGPEETLKKLSSFANTYGGYLVVGAEAGSADGRLTALAGVEPVPNFKQTIVQRCAGGVTPLIQPFVSDPIPAPGAPEGSGRVCYVVYVPESEEAPHFLNERKGGAYVRTDEYSKKIDAKPATADELLHLFDRRRLAVERREALVQRAADRFEQYAAADYAVPPATSARPLRDGRLPGGVGATMHLALVPRFPVAPLCESARVREIAEQRVIRWRQVGFPMRREGPLTQHESVLWPNAGGGFSLLEVNTWGLVSYIAEVERAWTSGGSGEETRGIHLHSMLGQALAALAYATTVYDALGFDGTLAIAAAFRRVRRVPIYTFRYNAPLRAGISRFDDAFRVDLTVSTDQLRAARDAVAGEVLSGALFALGWGDAEEPVGTLPTEEVLASAYEYNYWPPARG